MDSKKTAIAIALFCVLATAAEPPVPQGIRASNVLGGSGQHASFSFVRPGLTQTSYSFNGPSSHQAFSSSIGNPHLAQKVLPNVAQALAYRNPGLGYFSNGPITTAYASSGVQATPGGHPSALGTQIAYQGAPTPDQSEAAALRAYLQQQYQQQYQQQLQQQYLQAQQHQPQTSQAAPQAQPDAVAYQAQLAQIHALRQAQAQAQAAQSSEQLQQIPEQIQLQQQEQQQQQQTQNLLGVAYSSAPSVAHVKVSGNGYNFDF
ncbi:general transcriptional corepressor CYC8-like [Diprion similis]|uniref:general transcriptional corepressor CYC8-like n=1 Tax=Diprion similis TaxID=362088 RepID=UPI001EF807F4|nr:general transcriptional corepressor CYC8-like [Diprion similis]